MIKSMKILNLLDHILIKLASIIQSWKPKLKWLLNSNKIKCILSNVLNNSSKINNLSIVLIDHNIVIKIKLHLKMSCMKTKLHLKAWLNIQLE